jgi:phage terminase large subunit
MQIILRTAKRIADFLEANRHKRYVILRGGTRAGKTYNTLIYLLKRAMQEGKDIGIVGAHLVRLRETALRDFEEIVKDLPVIDYNRSLLVFTFPSGGRVKFFGADKGIKLRGAKRDILFINEANAIDFEVFSELDVRTTTQVILDFNPTGRFWINEFMESHPHPEWFAEGVFTYRDNPFLLPEHVRAIEARSGDPRWWKVFGEGEWGEASGLAWYNYEVVAELPETAKLVAVGVDFGFTRSPTAVVGVWKLGQELYVRELLYRHNLRLEELGVFLRQYRDASYIVADSAEPDLIAALRRQYNVPVVPSRKLELKASFALINAVRVKVVSGSNNLLNEAYKLCWEGDRLLGVDDHAIDALRYALHAVMGK